MPQSANILRFAAFFFKRIDVSQAGLFIGCRQFLNVGQVSIRINFVCMGLAGAGRIFKLLQGKTEKDFAVKHEKNTYEIRLNFSWIGDTIKWKRRE